MKLKQSFQSDNFYSNSKVEIVVNESDIDGVFNQSILKLNQTYKTF